MSTEQLPEGFVPLQKEGGRITYAACTDPNSRHYGWLMRRHPDGRWVSKRRLGAWELIQVDIQRRQGTVVEGGQG